MCCSIFLNYKMLLFPAALAKLLLVCSATISLMVAVDFGRMSFRSGRATGNVINTGSLGSDRAKSGFGSGNTVPLARIGSMARLGVENVATTSTGAASTVIVNADARWAAPLLKREFLCAMRAKLRIIRLFQKTMNSICRGAATAEWKFSI